MPTTRRLAVAVWIAGALTACAVATRGAGAETVVLEDLNSRARFDPGSAAGMLEWIIDGRDHLFQQWFWYRIGEAGGESPVDQLAAPLYIASNANFNPGDDHLIVRYAGARLRVDLTFDLMGGSAGSGMANIGEQINITNVGNERLDVHFFQYCNFDLDGRPADDTVTIAGGNRAVQETGGTYWAAESVVSGPPAHYQAGYYPGLLDSLTDALPTVLPDEAGPLGPANVSWAFQWDFVLNPGGSFQISKTKAISPAPLSPVPEPATCLILIGGALLPARRRTARK